MSRIGLFLPRSLREILVQAFWSLLYRLLALLGLERLLAGLRQRLGLFHSPFRCCLFRVAHAARLGAIGADLAQPIFRYTLIFKNKNLVSHDIRNIHIVVQIIDFAEVAAVDVLSPVGAVITIFVNPSVNVLANIGMHWGRRDGKRCRRGACERQDGAWNAHVVCDGRVGPAPGKTEEGGW